MNCQDKVVGASTLACLFTFYLLHPRAHFIPPASYSILPLSPSLPRLILKRLKGMSPSLCITKMLELLVQLTPPSKGSTRQNMSPTSFLISSETISPVKRKAHLPSVTLNQAKRFRLNPAPRANDKTIEQYHQRVSEALLEDQSKLQVAIPFDQTWVEIQK